MKNKNTWKQIINDFFSISQHKKIVKKKYCKNYFKAKLAVFCKQILAFIHFKEIMPVILDIVPELKYKSMNAVIDEIFMDNRAEIDLCISARKLIV